MRKVSTPCLKRAAWGLKRRGVPFALTAKLARYLLSMMHEHGVQMRPI